jgi:hypothetical protein
MITQQHTEEFDDELDDGWGGVQYNEKVGTQESSKALLQRAKKIVKPSVVQQVN